MKAIKEAENKAFCKGTHSLTYGAWQERQEAEIEKIQEIKEDPIQNLEEK
jgi:CDGSH-type Zn-finger protein